MRKNVTFLCVLAMLACSAIGFSACATQSPDAQHQQQIDARIAEYAASTYLVFWGVRYGDAQLPEGLAVTRNGFDAQYADRPHKVILITDAYTALNLSEADIVKLTEMRAQGFTVFFFDCDKQIIMLFAQKFGLDARALPDGSNYLYELKAGGELLSAYSFSTADITPLSPHAVLTTVLERMTH